MILQQEYGSDKNMAKLYFKYGVMNSGKSLSLITTAYNYAQQNKKTLIYTSDLDTRSGVKTIASRTGFHIEAEYLPHNRHDIIQKIQEQRKNDIYAILIDEAQFLSREQVLTLSYIVDHYNIPVLSWGLKNDFQNNLFEGSKALLEFADKIEEIKTVCTLCNRKATMNLRTCNGEAVYTGEQILIGDSEYLPVCRQCYFNYDELVK